MIKASLTPGVKGVKKFESVMLSPPLVILSEAKNPRSSLRLNSAKHLCSSSQVAEKKQLRRSFASLRMTDRLISSQLRTRWATFVRPSRGLNYSTSS